VPIVVGTGAPSARQAARLTAEVVAGGADAVLALSPPGSADPTAYYAELVRAAGAVPVLGYHFPAMSAPGIDLALLPRLTDVGVVGLKDSSGDASRLVRTVATFAGDLYVGSPWLLSAAGPLGATGAILAVANVEPELSVAAFAGDPGAQRDLATAAASAAGPANVKRVLGRSQVTRVG
jgi:4-hydroxy-tetrahydrodipicolinate synthase